VGTRAHQIQQALQQCMEEVAAQTGAELADMSPNTALHESGLDALGLAMVIAKLDEKLGCSPFRDGSAEGLPCTLAELVQLYQHADDSY